MWINVIWFLTQVKLCVRDLPELEETPEFLELLEPVVLSKLGDLPELENLEKCLELEKTMSEIDISEC